ncbi:MAG: hypothetical protein AAB316_00120, partial [Bacteroidota bacterium]
ADFHNFLNTRFPDDPAIKLIAEPEETAKVNPEIKPVPEPGKEKLIANPHTQKMSDCLKKAFPDKGAILTDLFPNGIKG